eukprot:TRINITY_DN6575_c0_g1_i2.p1 TRINITY_DN6575_c0_g1~~TRINITY_DN6575_c0_g1_i2.p1  ORF type:complete len:218 (-),score=50.31 TRINITY_DN6575_c0_g1_i2:152-805(-)
MLGQKKNQKNENPHIQVKIEGEIYNSDNLDNDVNLRSLLKKIYIQEQVLKQMQEQKNDKDQDVNEKTIKLLEQQIQNKKVKFIVLKKFIDSKKQEKKEKEKQKNQEKEENYEREKEGYHQPWIWKTKVIQVAILLIFTLIVYFYILLGIYYPTNGFKSSIQKMGEAQISSENLPMYLLVSAILICLALGTDYLMKWINKKFETKRKLINLQNQINKY